jgi:hypothetical protein
MKKDVLCRKDVVVMLTRNIDDERRLRSDLDEVWRRVSEIEVSNKKTRVDC